MIVGSDNWDTPGTETINLLVETEAGQVTTTFDITIAPPSQAGSDLFMPKLDK